MRDFTSPQPGVLLRSDDDGASWDVVARVENGGLRRVQFLDAARGWALATDILRTDDGGRSWTVLPTAGSLHDLFFLSRDRGVAVGFGPPIDPFSIQYPSLIVETTDGGEPWREAVLPGAATAPAFELLRFVCVRPDGVGVAGGRAPLLRTGDGGSTWQAVDALPFLGTGTTGCAVHPSGAIFLTSRGPGLFGSDDGGRTWSDTTSVLPPEIFPGELHGIAFTAGGTGFAVGSVVVEGVGPDDPPMEADPVVITTRDVAMPWARQSLPGRRRGSLLAVTASGDPGVAVVAGAPASVLEDLVPLVFLTTDGGASWKPAAFPDLVGRINGVQIVAERRSR